MRKQVLIRVGWLVAIVIAAIAVLLSVYRVYYLG
jgi:hypothetical protein